MTTFGAYLDVFERSEKMWLRIKQMEKKMESKNQVEKNTPEGELAEPEQISSVVGCNGLSIGITPPQSNITIMRGKHDIILRIEQINGTENDYRIIFNKEIFSTADEFAKEFIKIVETHVIKCL